MSDKNEIVVTHIEKELNHPPLTSSDGEDRVLSHMNEIVVNLTKKVLDHFPSTPSERILLKVPNQLRRVKREAYEPDIISIGPYHRGKDHLATIEEHKFCYLKLLLQQRGDSSIVKCVEALSELYKIAKNSYEERFVENISTSDFLETMLVDGCFIVELIRKGLSENMSIEDDNLILRSEMTLYSLTHDLLLLENQLPFFILQKLFDMTLLPGEENNLEDLIFRFFRILPGPGYKRREEHNFPKVPVRHLLELMHDNWLPSPPLHINWWLIIINETSKKCYAKAHIPCATRLQEAGIKFKNAEGCNNSERNTIFNIKFENGVLEIPKLTIGARTESLLRNLIAYELLDKNYKCHFIQYAKFMDCLINSNKDVELLCGSGIIDNWLGDDEVIASMFNRLLDNVSAHQTPLYSDVYIQVNDYCGRKWNLWKAKLKHDYFNGPWALISFLAAVFLLLITALQAVYSVLSYHHS